MLLLYLPGQGCAADWNMPVCPDSGTICELPGLHRRVQKKCFAKVLRHHAMWPTKYWQVSLSASKKGSLKEWFCRCWYPFHSPTPPAPLMLNGYFYTRSTHCTACFILAIFHLQINRHQCWVFTTLQHSGDDSMHQWELQHSMAPYALDGSLHGGHPPLDTPINLPIH